ncbi:CPBP family intramembrane metalloprotease [Microbacterium betulae]|uniref:CPBP family intramembrane metalloprotease n=1 Tax=Microbacterium betulae TaxID=2981139 RepID=A0AA97FJZ9_9MICO|nr:CPBP family intramembrane glutamic endopeptidase [Microbacterium sp. AB]WOF24356.1 CPBP family intramembrane metalloprotease [Microbacterium sp. AB]
MTVPASAVPSPDPQGIVTPQSPKRSLPAPPLERVPWAAVAVFVIVSFAAAWLVVLPLWLADGLANPLATLILPAMMLTPMLAVLVVTFVLKTPARGERLRSLGIWPLRPFARTIWLTVAAMYLPLVVIAATTFLAGALGFAQLDLTMAGFDALNRQQAAASGIDAALLPPAQVVFALQILLLPVGVLTGNALLALGEEVGWRGWLLPSLRPLGVWPSLLVSGAIWGLWHAPIILLGYNFGRADVVGVLLMVAGCVAWGVLFGWLRLRTGSVWPAVIGHASLNGLGQFIVFFLPLGASPDAALAGPLGVASWIVLAVVVAVLAACGQFRRRVLS